MTRPFGGNNVRKILALSLLLASTQALAVQYQIQQLPSLSVGGYAAAYGLNENGMVVGQALNTSTGQLEAVIWNNGSVSSLGFQGIARDVNNSGTVVGETGLALSVQIATGRAFKWDSTNGYVDLGDLGGRMQVLTASTKTVSLPDFPCSPTCQPAINLFRPPKASATKTAA